MREPTGSYDFRFADPKTGSVGFYGVLEEPDGESPFALGLKLSQRRIVEAEMIVARASEALIPFVTVHSSVDPKATAPQASVERTPRRKMIALADGCNRIRVTHFRCRLAFSCQI